MKRTIIALILMLCLLLTSCAGNTSSKDSGTTTDGSVNDDPPKPTTYTLKVGTYNVKHFEGVNHDFSIIAKDITSRKLEIVGLQEIDKLAGRSDGLDEPRLIAEALGWEYAFASAKGFDGGEYGHCIVSKHPIKSFNVLDLPGAGENRVLGHAVIDVNGVEINFLNTHLSHEAELSRRLQFEAIAAYVKELDNFIIVGDFNTDNFAEYAPIENAILINNETFALKTFSARTPTKSIDNIVVSSPVFTVGRPKVLNVLHSDHLMVYGDVTFSLEEAEK